MSEPARARRFPFGRIVRGILWIAIIFSVLAVIGITMLEGVGGSGDSLKAGMESFFQKTFGLKATIGTLNSSTFYPDLTIDMENLALRREAQGPVVASVDKLNVGMRFWDMALSRGLITRFDVQRFKADAGVFTPKAVEIDELTIQPPAEEGKAEETGETARIEGRGTYSGLPLRFSLEAEAIRAGRGLILYRLKKGGAFAVDAGDLRVTGKMTRPSFGAGLILDPLRIEGPHGAAEGSLSYVEGWGRWTLDGDLHAQKTHLRPDLDIEDRDGATVLSGRMALENLDSREFADKSIFGGIAGALYPFLEGVNFGGLSPAQEINARLKDIRSLDGSCSSAQIKGGDGQPFTTVCTGDRTGQ